MALPLALLDLENRSVGPGGEPTLGRALELAATEWRSGNRDRELRLHLLFLCWYCSLEPPFLTGFDESCLPESDPAQLFQEVYASFAAAVSEDPELLFTVGLMAMLAPWALGEDVLIWESRSAAFRARYRLLVPQGLAPAIFEGRGAYGEYFAHQVAVAGGF